MNKKKTRLPAAALLLSALLCLAAAPADAALKDGDIVFHTSRSAQSLAVQRATGDYEGRPYDLTFEWSDQRIYCSELVWKLYQRALGVRIGELQKIRSFNLGDPAVRAKMRERYGDKVPMDEPVISPVAMFESPLLTTVEAR
jgi:uncharacterized protein YycO